MYKVLLVDDEYMIQKSLKKLIENMNPEFEVIGTAYDGEEALQQCKVSNPNLVITDINMPVLDGLEMIKKIREKQIHTEIIILSGYDDFEFAQQAIRYNVCEFIVKPIKPNLLKEALDRLKQKIQSKEKEVLQRKQNVMFCKVRASAISQHLRNLNKVEIKKELDTFYQELLQMELGVDQERKAFIDYVMLIEEELGDVSLFTNETDLRYINLPNDRHSIYLLIEEILDSFTQRYTHKKNWGALTKISDAVDYIDKHFTEEQLTLNRVAALFNTSPSYFSRIFKEEKGVSFIKYVTQLRINKAKSLMKDRETKTSEIAHLIGYTDYPHFSKIFKKNTGYSPSNYRKYKVK
ncbi:response regulator transcription factor [Alteribacter aurantiacus]|uniref:response regulator transcription factor n=1 Tax=Alteribacter aurantiacus TaxID=254410 RepID=UPI00041A185F|nr:response regulator [Alteribacter aurantiacus]